MPHSSYDPSGASVPSTLSWILSELGAWRDNEKLVHLHYQPNNLDFSCNILGMKCIAFHNVDDISTKLAQTKSPLPHNVLPRFKYNSEAVISTSQEEERAARIIQNAARRCFGSTWDPKRKSEMDEKRAALYEQYRNASDDIDWPASTHKHIFLGALPHLLLFVNEIREYADETMTRANQYLRGTFSNRLVTSRLQEAT